VKRRREKEELLSWAAALLSCAAVCESWELSRVDVILLLLHVFITSFLYL
jgi:hypothetical protein